MATLDHLIVPSHDRKASAKLLADLLGVKSGESFGLFSAVYVNETLTIDFMQGDKFDVHHYCFSVTDEEFETSSLDCGRTRFLIGAARTVRWT
jgi:hypothetical protein